MDNFDWWSWEIFYPSLETLIFDCFTETYAITATAVKSIYGIQFKDKIDLGSLKELTYSEDGKTLEERIYKHFKEAMKKNNSILYFYNRIVLIIDTETLYISNHVIHGKLKKYATHVEVIGSPDCDIENNGMCEYYISKGKMPIEELEELPPYHPDCECEVIYYINEEKLREKGE